MVKTEKIQQAILRQNGGQFQEIMDRYLYKKYKFSNITCLGTKAGTSKTTKGTPDTYVELDNGKYILIMYGAVENHAFSKLKDDITDAYNIDKTHIDENKIEKVICCHTSNNISISQRKELKNIFKDKNVEIIGIDDLSYDIANNFQTIAETYLDIKVDSGQFLDIEEFVEKHDKNSVNAPLNINFIERNEKTELLEILNNEEMILLIGKAGTGKTRLAVEVCKSFIADNKDMDCICIKNNGNEIYDDLKDYIENGKNYLIFIDDINEMSRVKSFMDFVKDKKDICKIKVIATVRDYVLENVLRKLKEYYLPKIYTVNLMNDEQIKTILEENYSIKNSYYQEKILEISNGNPRLAILAAKGVVEGRIKSLNSVNDIFQSYYYPIISDNNLSEIEINCLFIISVLGPVSFVDENIIKIIEKLDIGREEFFETIKKLNKLELVDYFEGKATKICDQNFGNYIVYKVLVEDKKVSLSSFIEKIYPNGIIKIISAINMIYEIFYDKDIEDYINSEIKNIWNKEPYSSDSKFLYHFYNVDRIKALKMIKNEIVNEETKTIDLKKFDFNGKKNNQRIDDKRIEILSNFKYGEFNSEAIELLIEYYKKRPDLIMDFYFGFVLNLGIDEHSLNNKYKNELNIIEIFMNNILKDDEYKYNLSYLLIKIIENFLEHDRHITKQSSKKLTLNYIRIQLSASEEVFDFRYNMFKTIEQLYKIDNLKSMIDKLLINYDIYPSDEDSKKILKKDMEFLTNSFFCKWDKPNFIQCEILKEFEHKCIIANIDIPKVLEKYRENEEYLIIHTLKHERDLGEDWEKAEEERRNRVRDMVKNYSITDFSKFFSICSNVEKCEKGLNNYNVNTSILDIFDYILEEKEEYFFKIFEEYINYNAPFLSYPDFLLSKILNKYSYEDVLKILMSNTDDKKYCYLKVYYKNINIITDKDISGVFDLLNEQKDNKQVYILDIKTLIKYEQAKKGVLEEYCLQLLDNYSKKTYVISDFFNYWSSFEEEEIKFIIESFDNIEILEDLYILGSYNSIDNKGKLGIEILKKDNKFIYKIIDNMKEFQKRSLELDNIFNEIWKTADYESYIKMAFEEIEKQNFYYFEIEKFFSSEYGEKEDVLLRKQKWIEEYIKENYTDIEKMYSIFNVICNSFSNKKKEYILEYLKLNKSIEDFKKIPLFSSFSSWFGSEVPLIDKKIDFLNDLNNSINGLDYLEHKDYINKEIEIYKKYKIDIKVREYLEDYL